VSKFRKPKTLEDVFNWMDDAHSMSCSYVQDAIQHPDHMDWDDCDCKRREMREIVDHVLLILEDAKSLR